MSKRGGVVSLLDRNAMTSGARPYSSIDLPGRAIAAVAGAMLLFCGLAAAAQDTKPNPPAPEAAPAYQPGMLNSVGRWFKDSFSRFSSNVEGAREGFNGLGERAGGAAKDAADVAKDAAAAAKNAADAMMRLPNARVVEGHARCITAANGAPDCRQAAEAVCKGKGFGSGSSLDIQSAQKCSARVWLSRRPSDAGACEMESFVTRAVCQ
jgi:hypothetical protein